MWRRKVKIPAHKVAAAQNLTFELSTGSADWSSVGEKTHQSPQKQNPKS